MFSKGPALSPRSLIGLIVGITVVPLSTLLWLGWRLLEQDRILEGQQAQQRLERAADLMTGALQRAIASSEQRLAAGSQEWPDGAVAISLRADRIEAYPQERVAYLPAVAPLREGPSETFSEGEDLEFRKQDRLGAIAVFGELAKSSDPAIRAGALLRLGRNLSSMGRTREALAGYEQLSAMDEAAIGGVPAGLVGRYARCELLDKEKRASELRAEAERLSRELASGRWTLTAPVYWLYAGDAANWRGAEPPGKRQAEVFAEAAAILWEQWRAQPPSGQKLLAIGDQKLVVLWQNSGGLFRALIAAPEFIETQWIAAVAPVARERRISFRLGNGADAVPAAKRTAGQTALPWNFAVTSLDRLEQSGDFVLRRRLLIAGFVLLVAMALTAGYLIVRAVSRELAVARLQSDFVAAVSHEFRTPLTALRQFTDMLRENEHLNRDRRNLCYEAQSRATDRLTRLVESLLDFVRMEAGAHRYKFEQLDCAELVGRVVEDFRPDAEASGYKVEFRGNGSAAVDVDSEALARAVWNLLDNAVKYSPEHDTVEVGLNRGNGDVRIAVRDRGMGVPAHERHAIFSKFQRGEQARTRGIKGTGIGLAMVDEIVKAHHGRVEIESEPGRGSTFTIVLPARD